MSEKEWIRSHVEVLLQREWDVCRVFPDDDGDFFFPHDSAARWVTVMGHDPIMVRVFAHAAFGIKPTLAVLREINELQLKSLSAHVAHANGIVTVSQTVSPIGLTQPVLAQAMDAVAGIAAEIGPLFAAMFGGATPFPAAKSMDEEVA